MMLTHSGLTVIRAIRGNIFVIRSAQACPCTLPKYLCAAAAYSGTIPSTVSICAGPRICRTLCGQVLVSIVSATFGFFANAFTFGAAGGGPRTICLPFQWNQIGTTRGVPSNQMYAKRAGIEDRSNSLAIGSLSKAISPCFVAIHVSFFYLTLRYFRKLCAPTSAAKT